MNMAPIAQYQFAHVAPDRIEIRLATRRTVTAEEEAAMTAWVQKKFKFPFEVTFGYAEELPLTKAGKFKDFVVEF